MRMTTWGEYVTSIAGTTNQSRIAREIGVAQSTVGRWIAGAEPMPTQIVRVAERYGVTPEDAFRVAAGLPARRSKRAAKVERGPASSAAKPQRRARRGTPER